MTPYELYGPWEVEGYQVEIDVSGGVRLVASRDGQRLKALPAAVRASGDLAWMKLALEAATQHFRQLRTLLENAMIEAIPLSGDDLAGMALDPVGRAMLNSVLVQVESTVGRPSLDDWSLESRQGDFFRLGFPAVVVHPATLHAAGTLEGWDRWLSARWFKQPFKQIRRELYLPNADERRTRFFSDRFAGETIRWDQARALLEGRGWYRVTKTGAERVFHRAKLTAYVEFRTPMSRGFSNEDVVTGRIFFLPRGEQVVNRANPGIQLDKVPPRLFSEALRDVNLAARVANREQDS